MTAARDPAGTVFAQNEKTDFKMGISQNGHEKRKNFPFDMAKFNKNQAANLYKK